MLIRYKGGRSRMDISFNRIPYYFTPENNRILDIQDQKVVTYIFGLPNSSEFEAVVEPKDIIFNKENNTVTTSEKTAEVKIEKTKSKKGRK